MQKTQYAMRISDWSSDVCSSDLRKIVPALKFCRGDDFQDDHGAALLHTKLGLSRDVKLANLTVRHFLQVKPSMCELSTITFAKGLQARAEGVVKIREALVELFEWSNSTELRDRKSTRLNSSH